MASQLETISRKAQRIMIKFDNVIKKNVEDVFTEALIARGSIITK